MTSNQEKYLKYKFKYLNLKKEIALQSQSGGVIPINILIVSHNSRIRCFLKNLYKYKDTIPRLKNAAVVKLEIKPDSETIYVSLFYEGEVIDAKEGAYFVKEQLLKGKDLAMPPGAMKSRLKLPSTHAGNYYNIYIVRHGEATHNVDKDKKVDVSECSKLDDPMITAKDKEEVDDIKVDSNLTRAGIEQAQKAGIALIGIKFNTVFVSDLFRTIQTFNALNVESYSRPFVLQCSHEIVYSNFICGDSHFQNLECADILRKRVAGENVSICKDKKERIREKSRCAEPQHKIRDWKLYDEFITAGIPCKDTNMVLQAIVNTYQIMNSKEYKDKVNGML